MAWQDEELAIRWGDVDTFDAFALPAPGNDKGKGNNVQVDVDRPLVWRILLQAGVPQGLLPGETIQVLWFVTLGVGSSRVTIRRTLTLDNAAPVQDILLDAPAQVLTVSYEWALAGGGASIRRLEIGNLVTPYNWSEIR